MCVCVCVLLLVLDYRERKIGRQKEERKKERKRNKFICCYLLIETAEGLTRFFSTTIDPAAIV